MSTILLTGAAGFVGSHVLPALLEAGHQVIALVRSQGSGSQVLDRVAASRRSQVEFRTGDVTIPDSLRDALRGADAVVHLVAIPRDFDGGASLRLVNTEGTRNLLVAAEKANVRRFVHLGALGVADDPALHYARSKARAEALVARSGLDWTILKPSLMWGERDGFFNIIAGLARWSPGLIPVPGRGDARFQPLWVEDLARIVVRCLADPGATVGRAFELGGPRYWTYREITREVLRALGRPALIVPMPVPLISLVAGTAERLHIAFPVATDQLRQLKLDNVTSLDAVPGTFGFEPTDMKGRLGYLRRPKRRQEQDPADDASGSGAT